LETLSEHNCQGWLQGHPAQRQAWRLSEAFLPTVDGMMNQ